MDEQEREVIEDMAGEPGTEEGFDAEPVENDLIQEIVDKIRELVRKGNVAKIVISKNEHVLLNLPLNVGIVGSIFGIAAAPWALIGAAVATAGFDCTVELVKTDGDVIDLSPRKLGKQVVDAGTTVVGDIRSAVGSFKAAAASPEEKTEPEAEPAPDEEIPFEDTKDGE